MIRGLENWLPALRRKQRPMENALGTRHVLIAICNRFEPSEKTRGDGKPALLEEWSRDLSRLADEFSDGKAVAPKHTFFLPAENADAVWVPELGELCKATGNEIELMAPRPVESAECLRESIQRAKASLGGQGWLSCDKTGASRYGFIQGTKVPDSTRLISHRAILKETGCYASFLPPELVDEVPAEFDNSLCYAYDHNLKDRPGGLRRVRAKRGLQTESDDGLLLVPPPFARDWTRKKFGLLPQVETSELTAAKPPSRERLRLWLDCRITVDARPNWVFIALHTHGLQPENSMMLLGEPMRKFYRALVKVMADDESLRFHCVTARELINILHAAEAGHSGNPSRFKEFRYRAPAALSQGKAESGENPGAEAQSAPAEAGGENAEKASAPL
jgi:hypothetical protein